MSRLTEEDIKKNPLLIYTQFTNIYKDAITKYDAIQLYTYQSMSDNIKEYQVFNSRWKKSIKKVKRLIKDIEDNQFTGHVLLNQLATINNRMDQSDYILNMIPANLVVSLVTNFDQFLSEMLIYLFQNITGQINVIDECAKFSDLYFCNDKYEIQDFYIEKFIDSFFRKSHSEQIEWLDKKLSLNIKSKMPNYDDFIFLCELRNMIIHNDSKPNNHFMNTVDVEKYSKMGFNIKKNERILISPENIKYLSSVVQLVTSFIFGLLGQKYYHKDDKMMEFIESEINSNIVEKIKKEPELAILLLNNQLSSHLKHTSEFLYIYNINLCISYKKLGNETKMKEILKSMDWSNCSDRYIYAKNVLLENKDNIVKYMHKFVEPEWKLYYQIWPLFYKLRKEDYFKEEYQKIFSEEFIYDTVDLTVTPSDIQKAEKELKKKQEKEDV